jgi:hypothetical protein
MYHNNFLCPSLEATNQEEKDKENIATETPQLTKKILNIRHHKKHHHLLEISLI